MKTALKSINDYLRGGITSTGIKFTVWEGGDMKWLAIKSALRAIFAHDDTCPWCRVERKNLGSKQKSALRTSQNSRTASHLPPLDEQSKEIWPFTCDMCDITYNNKEEWLAEDLSNEADAKLLAALKHAQAI